MRDFRRDHDHRETGRGQNVSVYFRKDVLRAIDRQRGGRSRSGYLSDLVVEQDRGVLSPVKTEALSPLLRDARVTHPTTRHPGTRKIYLSSSYVVPSKKTGADVNDPAKGAGFSIRHDLRGDELPATAKVRSGEHYLDTSKCDGCKLVARDDWH
ncbi:MAG: hypothetical protein V3U33_06415 [candidate division NC10 bacterium]